MKVLVMASDIDVLKEVSDKLIRWPNCFYKSYKSKIKMKLDIVVCPDKQYVMPTGVMMQSVCVNNPDVDIVFHVIVGNGVTDSDKKDLESITKPFGGKSVLFYMPNHRIQQMSFPKGIENHITKAAFYRLFIAELLPQKIEKVLYLDGDVIVRHSLLPLWNTDINRFAIAATPDMWSGMNEYYTRLHYSPDLGYFNSGVLLINLKFWREEMLLESFVSYMLANPEKIRYHDQDVLNVLLKEKKLELPVTYNFQNGFLITEPLYDVNKLAKEIKNAINDPVIVHYTADKPWYAYTRYPEHPFASSFFKYQNQTKWKGVKTDWRPFKRRFINFIADILRRFGLKSQLEHWCHYIEIAPID